VPNIKNDRKLIILILEQLLLQEPMNKGIQTELRELAKDTLVLVASAVKETDKLLEQVDKTSLFKLGIQMLCHASLCSAQALHNGVTNLVQFWQFEVKSGTAVGRIVPQLRSFRSELEVGCVQLADKVEEQLLVEADEIANIAKTLMDRVKVVMNVAREPIQGDKELSVLKREIDSAESNLLRLIFFSCAMREQYTPGHSRLLEVKEEVNTLFMAQQKLNTLGGQQKLNSDRVVADFKLARISLESAIDVCSRPFVPAVHKFGNNAFAMIETDMDSFVERNLNLQIGTKDVVVPCDLTLRAVKQINQIFRRVVRVKNDDDSSGVIAVASGLRGEDLRSLCNLVESVSALFNAPINGEDSWMHLLVKNPSPLTVALDSLEILMSADAFVNRDREQTALQRLQEILERTTTETFASAIVFERSKFSQHVGTLRFNLLPLDASPQVVGEERVNWDVFTLDLFLNKEDLYKRVVNRWKPVPPGRDVLDQWFGKFELLVSCLVLGIEKLADTIVDTYRCAPKLLSKENLLLVMRNCVTMAQDVLSMKLTDFSSDPSTLSAPGGLMMVPAVLECLHRGELDLFEAMKNDKWGETMDTIAGMSSPNGSFLAACNSFKEKAENGKKDWKDAVTLYVMHRDEKRRHYYKGQIEVAQKRCDDLNARFEREEKEWQQKNDIYKHQKADFLSKGEVVKPLLIILLVRAYTQPMVQDLMKEYKDFCSQDRVKASFANGGNKPISLIQNVPYLLRVTATAESNLKEVHIVLGDDKSYLVPIAPERSFARAAGNALSGGYIDSCIYLPKILNIRLPVNASSLSVQIEGRFGMGLMRNTPKPSNILKVCMSKIINSSVPCVETLSSNHKISLCIEKADLFTAHPWTISSVDTTTDFDLQQTLREAKQALHIWRGSVVSAPQPGPPVEKTNAEDMVETLKKEAHRANGFDADYQKLTFSGQHDLIQKLASLADNLHVSGRAFCHKASEHAATTQLDDLLTLIMCSKETAAFAVTVDTSCKVHTMLSNRILLDRIHLANYHWWEDVDKFWSEKMIRVYGDCQSMAMHHLFTASPDAKGLVTMLAASLCDIMIRTYFIEAVVTVTQNLDPHKTHAPEVYTSHFTALLKEMDRDDSRAAKRLFKMIKTSSSALRPHLDRLSVAGKTLRDLSKEAPGLISVSDTWLRVFNTSIGSSTTIVLQRMGSIINIRPPSTYVFFGCVLLGSAADPMPLRFVNDSRDPITLQLSLLGDGGERFRISSNKVSVPGASWLIVDLTLFKISVVGRLEANLEVSSDGMNTFLVPLTADIHEPGLKILPVSSSGVDQVRVVELEEAGSPIKVVYLGTVRLGSKSKFELTIKNMCGASIQIKVQEQKHDHRSQFTCKLIEQSALYSVAHVQAYGQTTMALELEAREIGDFACNALLAIKGVDKPLWIRVEAYIRKPEFELWDGESKLGKGSSVSFGNVESGYEGTKTIKVVNTGEVLLHYAAKMGQGQSCFGLSSSSGQIQSGQVLYIRISYRPKGSKKDSATDNLTICFNNDDLWPLKVSASCGEMEVILMRRKELIFALDLGENATLNKTCLEKELKVELRNAGDFPISVELQPHPLVKTVGDAKCVIEKGRMIDLCVMLHSFPPGLATSSPSTMVFKTDSKKQNTIEVPFSVNIKKAGLEVKPVGHIDLGLQPIEQELDRHWLTVSNFGKKDLVYSMNSKVLQGSGTLILMRDKNPRTVVNFNEEAKIKTSRDINVNRFILSVEAEEGFEGPCAFELNITGINDLVLAPGTRTKLIPRIHTLYVTATIKHHREQAVMTLSAPKPIKTPEWALLKTKSIFNSWSCGLRSDDAATGLVPAALIASSCGGNQDYFKVLTDLRVAVGSSAVGGGDGGVTAADLNLAMESSISAVSHLLQIRDVSSSEFAENVRLFARLSSADDTTSLQHAIASFSDTFVQKPTEGSAAASVCDFSKASAFQATLRALAIVENDFKRLKEEKNFGMLVHGSCNIVLTSCESDLFAPYCLSALFGEDGKLGTKKAVESLLMSQVLASGKMSDSKVLSVLVSIGDGLTSGNWVGLIESVASEFAGETDSRFRLLQCIVGQETGVLFACRDVIFEGMNKKLLNTAKGAVVMIDKIADSIASDAEAVSCHDLALSFPFFLAAHMGKMPKELHTSLKSVLFKRNHIRGGLSKDILQCVTSILSLSEKTSDELSDFCFAADHILSTQQKSKRFCGHNGNTDLQWRFVFEAFKACPPQSTFLQNKMRDAQVLPQHRVAGVAAATAAPSTNGSPEQDEARNKFVEYLHHLSSFDTDADATKLFDQCVKLCSELVDDDLEAEKFSLNVVRGLIKTCYPADKKSVEKLDAGTLMAKGFKLVSSITGQRDALKQMKKAASNYFEKRNSKAAVNLSLALVEFTLACRPNNPDLLSESEHEIAVKRCEYLKKASELCPVPLYARFLELVVADLPDHECKKLICEKIRSVASLGISAKSVQNMFQVAIECVQSSCACGELESILMCSVRRCFKKTCDEWMKGLRICLPAVYNERVSMKIDQVVKSVSSVNIVAKPLLATGAVELVWQTFCSIRGMPDSLSTTAEAGRKILALRGKVLTGPEVFEVLGAWRQCSSNKAVAWLIQMLQGIVMRCTAAEIGSDVMRVSGSVLLFASVHSMVRSSCSDKLVLFEENGAENFLTMLPPTFFEAQTEHQGDAGIIGGRQHPEKEDSKLLGALPPCEPHLNPEAIAHFKKISHDGSRNVTTQLGKIKELVFPAGADVSLWSTSTRLPELINAVVLIRSVANEWVHSCSHMSRIAQAQHDGDAEISAVAEALFKAGLLLMRLMNAILVMGQPFSLQDQCAFYDVKTLLGTVLEIMLALSVEVKDKPVTDYLNAMKKCKHVSKDARIDLFQMPSKDTCGPGREKRRVDTHDFMKNSIDRFMYHAEEQTVLSHDDDIAEEETVGKGDIKFMVQRSEAAGGLSSDELRSVDIDPNLQWLDLSATSSDTKPTGSKQSGDKLISSRGHVKKGGSGGPTSLSLAGKQKQKNNLMDDLQAGGDFDMHGKVDVKLQAETGEKVKVEIKIDKAMIRRQLENANIDEIYKEIPPQRRRDAKPVADPLSCRINPNEKDEKWTYQRLVECKPMATFIESVLWNLRETIPQFFQKSKHPYVVCICGLLLLYCIVSGETAQG